jgi:hypothetical protein
MLLEILIWKANGFQTLCLVTPQLSRSVSKWSLEEFICSKYWRQVPSLPLLTRPPTVTATALLGFQLSDINLSLYFN